MNYFALLLPLLLIVGLFAGLVILKRHLFGEQETPAPIPIPDLPDNPSAAPETGPAPTRSPAPHRPAEPAGNGISLAPARLYPDRVLGPAQMSAFSHLLKALPGYVVLPKISYGDFLAARDGSPSENTSLQNRAAQHVADFVICNRKLDVLLVCQIEDGSQTPARTQEREKMLQKAGLRLLRWNVDQAPEPARLLTTVQTLERLRNGGNRDAGMSSVTRH